ncbi:tiny macrocysts protein B, partial [Haematococcus lacustris]
MQESVVDLNAVGHTVPGVRGLQNATQEIGESMEDLDVIMPELKYLDSNPITVTNVTTNLWDLGNDLIGRVQKLQHNAAAINASGRRLSDTADYLFIMANGMDSVWGGYQKTLSSFVELTVRNSDRMNMVHLVVLGVEGILLTW